jgi:hypothetical protein
VRAAKARRHNLALGLRCSQVVATPTGRTGMVIGPAAGGADRVIWRDGKHTTSPFRSINVPLKVVKL